MLQDPFTFFEKAFEMFENLFKICDFLIEIFYNLQKHIHFSKEVSANHHKIQKYLHRQPQHNLHLLHYNWREAKPLRLRRIDKADGTIHIAWHVYLFHSWLQLKMDQYSIFKSHSKICSKFNCMYVFRENII